MSKTDDTRLCTTSKQDKERKAMDIPAMVKEVYQNAVDHGWCERDRSFGELIALCHSELSEALEEYRNGHRPDETYFNESNPAKPEGVPSELADVIIRIFDICGEYNIDIESAIKVKHEYNKSRPYKHGGKVF